MDLARIEAWLTGRTAGPPLEEDMRARGQRDGFPVIGPLVGSLYAQMIHAVGARRVFEMGSGFGYSTLWAAHAVGPGGIVVHTDGSTAMGDEAKEWMAKAGLQERVRFEVGDARDILRAQDGTWDVVFIDIDKEGYPEAWDLAKDRVRRGGLIFTDNALWSGRVMDEAGDEVGDEARDDATRGVVGLLDRALGDPDFYTTVVPLRDGVALSLRL